jgi:hypothetical protein
MEEYLMAVRQQSVHFADIIVKNFIHFHSFACFPQSPFLWLVDSFVLFSGLAWHDVPALLRISCK